MGDPVLQDPIVTSSTSVLAHDTGARRLDAPVVPTVQLKANHNTQSASVLPKATDVVSGDVNAQT